MGKVQLAGVRKTYGEVTSLHALDLAIGEGEFFSLLGPSGCGKTTTLRILAGFINPDSGRVLIDDRDVTGIPPEGRNIGMVFQNYAIFPHMNVFDNIAFGLRVRKMPRSEIEKRVRSALAQVGLSGYERRYQKQMSGGERQRVALARVLVTEPRILLLDEPLSALDKAMREEMKYWIKSLQRELRITTVYVTHDQGEALAMSDRLAVMEKGKVLQIGSPEDVYERPASRFVASFIGHSNILEATVSRVGGGFCELEAGGVALKALASDGLSVGDRVLFAVRPENLLLDASVGGDDDAWLDAAVVDRSYQGSIVRYEVRAGEALLVVEAPNRRGDADYPPGAKLRVRWNPASAFVFRD